MKTFDLLGILRIIIAVAIGVTVVSGFASFFFLTGYLDSLFTKPTGFLLVTAGVVVTVISYIATVADEE